MTAQAGDPIVVESERVAQPVRRGVKEVLQQEPPHFRIRWDDVWGAETARWPSRRAVFAGGH
jgi:hypothetical protein